MFIKIITFLFIFSFHNCYPESHIFQEAGKGTLDLSTLNMESTTVTLGGEWEFYWKSIGDTWKNRPKEYARVGKDWRSLGLESGTGYATYRIQILLPQSEVGNFYLLKIYQAGGAAQRVSLNGKVILELGRVGISQEEMQPTRSQADVGILVESEKLELIFELSNYYHYDGALWYPPELGRFENISRISRERLIIDSIIIGILIIIVIYNMIVYYFRRDEKIFLYFGLTCIPFLSLLLTYSNEVQLSLFPKDAFKLSFILSMAFVMIVPVYLLYLYHILEKSINKKFVYMVILISSLSFILTIFLPPFYASILSIPNILFSFIVTLTICILLIIEFKNKKKYAGLYLLANIILLISSMSDTLTVYSIIKSETLMKYSFLLFVIIQMFVIAKKYSERYYQIKSLSDELLKNNAELEKKIIERTQEYRIQKERAENENLWKDKFVSLVTHDLRSPLANILLSHEILLSNSHNQDMVKAELLKIKELVMNSITMVKHLLCLSRFQSRDTKLQYSDVDLLEIFEYMQNEFNFEIERKKITLQSAIPENTILTVDETVFKEIIRNILMNSFKFSEEESFVKMSYEENEKEQIIVIKDFGIGMEKQVVDRILHTNSRRESILESKHGYGMGLKLSLDFLRLHHGKMEIDSHPNRGTEVRIYLPLNRHTVLFFSREMDFETHLESLRKKGKFPIHVDSLVELDRLLGEVQFEEVYSLSENDRIILAGRLREVGKFEKLKSL